MMSFPRPTRLAAGFLLGVGLVVLPAGLALAQSNDVRIDSLKLGKGDDVVELKGIDFAGSNLSREEIDALLAIDTPADRRTSLGARLKASSASIAEIVIGVPARGPLTFTGFRAENVDQGKIRRLTLAGGQGGPTIQGETGSFRAGALTIDEIDVSSVLNGLIKGSLLAAKPTVARLSWNGFEASFPDKDVPASAPGGNMVKIRLGALDAQTTFEGGMPTKSTTAIRNLVVELPKASETGKTLADAGYERIDVSMTSAIAFNPAKKSLMIDDLTISGVGMGSVGLRAEFGNIDPALLTGDPMAALATLMTVEFTSTELTIVNDGLIDKALAVAAKEQGKKPEQLKKEAGAMVTQFAPMMLGGDPSSLQVAAALGAFIRDPKSLSVKVSGKDGPLKFTDMDFDQPMSILQDLEITAAANGISKR
jgi:hypothetical protein